jgi:hypothetical protein
MAAISESVSPASTICIVATGAAVGRTVGVARDVGVGVAVGEAVGASDVCVADGFVVDGAGESAAGSVGDGVAGAVAGAEQAVSTTTTMVARRRKPDARMAACDSCEGVRALGRIADEGVEGDAEDRATDHRCMR